MKEAPDRATTPGASGLSPADEMGIPLLRYDDRRLSIVGLGGSAGGIAALQAFFAAMPVDSGMAFVVILHLSPHHESTLAAMFQRSTAMPVVAATDGVAVEPNSVYVILPGKLLASADGFLNLTDAQETRGRRVAVDHFFRTLAETHGTHSLAVVLSGTGGDGALGLKRIKELGGLTIAQDPDEAEHPDMPRSAIATGVVDWVLGVKEMPAKLLAYEKQRGELKLPGEDGPHPAETVELSPDEQEAALGDVLAFVHTRTGRDFSCYKRATILRRIARRMQINGLADLSSYLVYLRTHAGEAGALSAPKVYGTLPSPPLVAGQEFRLQAQDGGITGDFHPVVLLFMPGGGDLIPVDKLDYMAAVTQSYHFAGAPLSVEELMKLTNGL